MGWVKDADYNGYVTNLFARDKDWHLQHFTVSNGPANQ